jgi:hypothetical protein
VERSAVSFWFSSAVQISRPQSMRETSGSVELLKEQKRKGEHPAPPQQVAYLSLTATYLDALSARPLRNISLTVASKWRAPAGVGTAPLKIVRYGISFP